ncbi:hypothetical protein [Olsenella urininfantis]|uniref:hypothetical protein n=1 Tax=Olsenella urininfantis TaxID=1871033 RepID=UPI00117FCAB7|nr:hypothetical protein [Olsenella urininfantis]
MIGLVVLDMDTCMLEGGLRPGVPRPKDALDALIASGVPLALCSAAPAGDLWRTLGEGDSGTDLIARDAASGGWLLLPAGDGASQTLSSLEDALACLLGHKGLAPSDALLLSAGEPFLAAGRLGLTWVAPEDSPSSVLLESDRVVASRSEGGLSMAMGELARSLPWGEAPSFLRAGEQGHGLGELEDDGARGGFSGGLPLMVLGLLVTALAVLLMLSLLSSNLTLALAAVLLALAGLGIFYMGLGKSRDARRPRR